MFIQSLQDIKNKVIAYRELAIQAKNNNNLDDYEKFTIFYIDYKQQLEEYINEDVKNA